MKFLPLICFALVSCSSTQVMLGPARTPTDPASVRIYSTPPPAYEEIALLKADNRGQFRWTEQGRVEVAMQRLRENAAKLGANGVILRGVASESGAITTGYAANGSFTATTIPTGHLTKVAEGVAVWVK